MNAAMAVGILMGVLIATGCFAMACLVWMGRAKKDDTEAYIPMTREKLLMERLRNVVGTDDPDLIRKMLDEAHMTREWPEIVPGPHPISYPANLTAKELAARLESKDKQKKL